MRARRFATCAIVAAVLVTVFALAADARVPTCADDNHSTSSRSLQKPIVEGKAIGSEQIPATVRREILKDYESNCGNRGCSALIVEARSLKTLGTTFYLVGMIDDTFQSGGLSWVIGSTACNGLCASGAYWIFDTPSAFFAEERPRPAGIRAGYQANPEMFVVTGEGRSSRTIVYEEKYGYDGTHIEYEPCQLKAVRIEP